MQFARPAVGALHEDHRVDDPRMQVGRHAERDDHPGGRSGVHNFHVFGPGLDEVMTTVPFRGTVTRKIHLRHGQYTFQCDPHSFAMNGTFTVRGVGQD